MRWRVLVAEHRLRGHRPSFTRTSRTRLTGMATKRWKVAGVGKAVLWGIYDDVTQEILYFEVENLDDHDVRLTVTRFGKTPEVLERGAHQPSMKRLTLANLGQRVVRDEDGEIQFLGLTLHLETRPRA